jgi:hypothetical protein
MQQSFSSVPHSIRALAMTLALAAGGTLGVAYGDEDKKESPKVDRIEGDFNERIDEVERNGQAGGRSTFTISNTWTEGGKSYSVTNRNGEISVKVDGEALDAKRWRQQDGTIEILDENGDVVTSTQTPSMNNGNIRMRWGGRGGAQGGGAAQNGDPFADVREMLRDMRRVPQPPDAPAAPAAPRPPVMLGISMSAGDGGVYVDRVIEDLPADKAGLRKGDVITRVGDRDVEDVMDVSRALRDRKPGEKLDIVVMRNGRERTLTADLVAYDADVVEVPAVPAVPGVPNFPQLQMLDDLPLLGNAFSQQNEEARARLTELAEELRAKAESLAGERADAAKAMEEAKKALKDAADRLAEVREQMQEQRAWNRARGNVWVAPGDGNGQVFVLPENGGRMRVERDRGDRARSRDAAEVEGSADDLKALREEMRTLREEMKELREKNEQESKNKP